MITSAKHPSYQYLRKVMVIPIAAILFGLLAFKIQSKENKVTGGKTQIPITVVIDPGHGGKDPGVILNGIKEKDICLAIAKKIKEMNKDENIHLLFTRLDDSYTSPLDDAAFAETNKADLLIALHVNATDVTKIDESKKGIEVYVSYKKKEDYKSEVIANSLINELQNTYDINRYVLKKDGIWILDAPKCAVALIEVGYITNPEDFKFISNEENQEKIASDILTAIQKYAVVRAEGIIEENEPIKFETEKQTGKNIVTYHGKEIKEISPYGLNRQLVLIFDSSQQLLSKEKSESILKQHWNQIKNIYIPVYDTNKYGGNGKSNGVEKTTDQFQRNNENKDTIKPQIIFTKVEVEPSYPGGDSAWRKYLEKNLNPNVPLEKDKMKAGKYTVEIRYIIDKDGKISDIEALNYKDTQMAKHCIDIISKSGKWLPAIQNGRKVKAYKIQPITFVVSV